MYYRTLTCRVNVYRVFYSVSARSFCRDTAYLHVRTWLDVHVDQLIDVVLQLAVVVLYELGHRFQVVVLLRQFHVSDGQDDLAEQ